MFAVERLGCVFSWLTVNDVVPPDVARVVPFDVLSRASDN